MAEYKRSECASMAQLESRTHQTEMLLPDLKTVVDR